MTSSAAGIQGGSRSARVGFARIMLRGWRRWGKWRLAQNRKRAGEVIVTHIGDHLRRDIGL